LGLITVKVIIKPSAKQLVVISKLAIRHIIFALVEVKQQPFLFRR